MALSNFSFCTENGESQMNKPPCICFHRYVALFFCRSGPSWQLKPLWYTDAWACLRNWGSCKSQDHHLLFLLLLFLFLQLLLLLSLILMPGCRWCHWHCNDAWASSYEYNGFWSNYADNTPHKCNIQTWLLLQWCVST